MGKSIHREEYEELIGLLREWRVRSGVKQIDISSALGRSQSFISDVERGERRLDVVELRDFCQLIGTDLVSFVRQYERRLEKSIKRSKTGLGRTRRSRG